MTLSDRMTVHHVPGVSIAVMQAGEVIATHTEGVRDTVSLAPVDTNTVFQAASISKPVFATILMRYRDQHELNLDADINTLLKRWQLPAHPWSGKSDVTLRRLLSHTAGTTVYGYPGYARGETLPDLIDVLTGSPPANMSLPVVVDIEPGTQFRYSGGGFGLAQMALEDVSGTPLVELAHSYLFEPLDMRRSSFTQPIAVELQDNAAAPHDALGNPVPGGAYTFGTAVGGLWTTPSDILKWVSSVQRAAAGHDGEIISPVAAREMLTNSLGPVGIGFFTKGEGESRRFRHSGSNKGYEANFFVYENSGDGIAIMTNGSNGYRLIAEIFQRAADLYGWAGFSPISKTILDQPPGALLRFAGTYAGTEPDKSPASVSLEGDALVLNAGHWVTDMRFYPESETEFFSTDGSDLVFTLGNDGGVEALAYRGFVKAVKIE